MSQQVIHQTEPFPMVSVYRGEKSSWQAFLPKRNHIYPLSLVMIYATWFIYMASNQLFGLFEQHLSVTATMTLGSVVSGATAEGGAAIAFPVFTKALHIAPSDARTFGLMIQSTGMMMAGLVILLIRIPILKSVILYVSVGGVLGQLIGTFWIVLPNPYPRILFTFVAATFGLALFVSRYVLKWQPRDDFASWDNHQRGLFFIIGMIGGAFATQTGSGIDMLTFIVLTLAFGINEKISTPTTVIIMGVNSVVGFLLHGFVVQDIGVAWDYWLVAMPIVIIGAPLGVVIASRVKRDVIIGVLLVLIALEVGTTIWLVPLSPEHILVTVIAILICLQLFSMMLAYRHSRRHDALAS